MRHLTLLALPIAAMALTACQPSEEPGITEPWVRLGATRTAPAAAYFSIKGAAENDRLLMVTTDVAQRTELHESRTGPSGMAQMAPLPNGVEIPAGKTVRFEPGGLHLMIFGLSPDVQAGSRLKLNFTFASGRRYAAIAFARAPDGGGN